MPCIARGARRTFHWTKKCNPLWWFANADDGWVPGWYEVMRPRWLRALMWFGRNPMHNLTFYVIGVADRPRIICGPHGDAHDTKGAGWLWSVTKVGWVRLPYVNYTKGRIKAYAGWRPAGAFGFKLNWERKK